MNTTTDKKDMQTNNTQESQSQTSFEGDSFADICSRVFDPARKFSSDMRFIELQGILKNYPGDLSAFILAMQNRFEEMYNTGVTLQARYFSQQLDNEVLRAEIKILKKEISDLTETINFK